MTLLCFAAWIAGLRTPTLHGIEVVSSLGVAEKTARSTNATAPGSAVAKSRCAIRDAAQQQSFKTMIHVIAVVTAKPGHREQVLGHFRANMPAVQAEMGCVEYEPVIDAREGGAMQEPFGEDTFVVIEKWATIDDLRAHAASSHMAAYGATVKDLLASRSIRVLTSAAG